MYLIIGGDGSLGKNLSSYWGEKEIKFHSSTRRSELASETRPFIDLEDPNSINLLCKYDVVVLLAAISKLSYCEENPILSRKTNVINTYKIAKLLSETKAYILFISSNQVFDGTVPFVGYDNVRMPVNEYGRQKVEVEDLISKLPKYGILRLTKVIHHELELLIDWENKLKNGIDIYAFDDMSLAPVYITDVLSKIDNIIKNKSNGVFQCASDQDISYYDFAMKFAKEKGFSSKNIKRVSCKNRDILFSIPKYTSLMGA